MAARGSQLVRRHPHRLQKDRAVLALLGQSGVPQGELDPVSLEPGHSPFLGLGILSDQHTFVKDGRAVEVRLGGIAHLFEKGHLAPGHEPAHEIAVVHIGLVDDLFAALSRAEQVGVADPLQRR